MKLLLLASVRDLIRHPWLTALCVLGISAGVGLVLAVDLAIESSERAFTITTEAMRGRGTHRIHGGSTGVPDDFYRVLRVEEGLRSIAPVVEAEIELVEPGSGLLRLLGVDPYAEAPFRSSLVRSDEGGGSLLTQPGAVLIQADRAARLGLSRGDPITVQARGLRRRLVVGGTFRVAGPAAAAAADLLLTDVATAQEVLDRVGRLSRIDVNLDDGTAGARDRAVIESRLQGGLSLEEVEPAADPAAMTRAFRLNLGFLSLLAIVVAAFLIFNTMTFAVVRRRELYGRLRAIGVTPREIVAGVLAEGAIFALLGTALGVVVGIVLGRGLIGIVSRTLNDLYFVVSVNELSVSAWSLTKAGILGVGATLAVALLPAREASRATPRQALLRSSLESETVRRAPRRAWLGLAAGALCGASLLLDDGLVSCYLALGGLVIGLALTTPLVTAFAARLARPVLGRLLGPVGRMAARGVETSLSRTSVAIGALAVALSLTLGVRVMIDSFRQAVVAWLDDSLRADVYVSVPRPVAGGSGDAVLDRALVDTLTTTPGLAAVTTNRTLEIASDRGAMRLVVLALDPARPRGFTFRAGNADEIWPAFDAGEAVIVSEPLAWRVRLSLGDALRLETDDGPRSFPVVGVFRDFASEHGYAVLSRAAYERSWRDRRVTALGLFGQPGVDLVAALDRRAGRDHGLSIRSNAELKAVSIAIFDRTFTITSVLRLLAGVVALIGALSALMSLQLERKREIAILRASGLGRRGVFGLGLVQAGLMGLVAALLATPLGALFSWILTGPVNRRSFGWTMPLDLAPSGVGEVFLLGAAGALMAGLLPALAMARTSPASALRGE